MLPVHWFIIINPCSVGLLALGLFYYGLAHGPLYLWHQMPEVLQQTERCFQKQPTIFLNKKRALGRRVNRREIRFVRNPGLGFKAPRHVRILLKRRRARFCVLGWQLFRLGVCRTDLSDPRSRPLCRLVNCAPATPMPCAVAITAVPAGLCLDPFLNHNSTPRPVLCHASRSRRSKRTLWTRSARSPAT